MPVEIHALRGDLVGALQLSGRVRSRARRRFQLGTHAARQWAYVCARAVSICMSESSSIERMGQFEFRTVAHQPACTYDCLNITSSGGHALAHMLQAPLGYWVLPFEW